MTPETETLKVSVNSTNGMTLVALKGSVTMADTEILQQQLQELAERPDAILIIDLSELDFIGANGIHALLIGRAESEIHHGKIRLVHPNPEIKRMLELISLTEVFPIKCYNLSAIRQPEYRCEKLRVTRNELDFMEKRIERAKAISIL